jgi:predicted NAD/FAD-binding protein
MLWDVVRFNLFALDLVETHPTDRAGISGNTAQSKEDDVMEVDALSIGEYLEREGYSDAFKEDYLLVSRRMSRMWG